MGDAGPSACNLNNYLVDSVPVARSTPRIHLLCMKFGDIIAI